MTQAIKTRRRSPAKQAIFAEVFGPWAKTKTKAGLYHEGQRRHISLAPINTPADILGSGRLAHREFFVRVPHPALAERMLMPGAPYKLSRTPWRIGCAAPRLGEHTREVLHELIGMTPAEVERLAEEGVLR